MNRIIKFRGKRVDNGEWIYGLPVDYCNKKYILVLTNFEEERVYGQYPHKEMWSYEVIPETVGQYTGVDEIYEGDVLTSDYYPFKDEDKSNYNAIVYWDIWALQFCIQLHCVNPNKIGISDGMCEALSERGIKFEIIGNVFDNPELLKVR